MLLRNYDNIVAHAMSIPSTVNASEFKDGSLSVKNYLGNVIGYQSFDYEYSSGNYVHLPFTAWKYCDFEDNLHYGSWRNSMLVIGSGTREVTYDDYDLESRYLCSSDFVVNTSVGYRYSSPTYNEALGQWESSMSVTYTALKDLSISEIGVHYVVPKNTGAYGGSQCLVYRKVLENKIDVPVNSNFVLTFTIRVSAHMNKPTDYEVSASVTE
jgi:hypothetical protein